MLVSFKNVHRLVGFTAIMLLSFQGMCFDTPPVPKQWALLQPIISARLHQIRPKMKLTPAQVQAVASFLQQQDPTAFPHLQILEKTLPKTTLELLIAIESRAQDKIEAEKIAVYLDQLVKDFQFKNVAAFDENTSHIIGREWSEIDYSGEGMTWQGQKAKYQPYDITNFKTLACLQKFFPVEARLPYFNEAYEPQKKAVLRGSAKP